MYVNTQIPDLPGTGRRVTLAGAAFFAFQISLQLNLCRVAS